MDLVKKILKRDMNLFYNDLENQQKLSDTTLDINLVADFTEYNPLHNGHFHCMNVAKSKVNDSLFVAIVPGLFERSGRGIPYILPRQLRAKIAILVGCDIVVEGPPMGVMGSGQYSLCLANMFKALNTDYIPRGYNPVNGFNEILLRINQNHHIVPKPYKIVDKSTNETLLKDKLLEDNYVIVSLSNALSKIGFNYKNKFIFVERIGGVSGTKIREAVTSGNFNNVKSMMPDESIEVLENNSDKIIYDMRDNESILDTANNYDDLASLNMFNEKLANKIINNRSYSDVGDIELVQGFSTHHIQRILSILENPITKKDVSRYIDNYPSVIRVLGYKNKEVLDKFLDKIAVCDVDYLL